MSIGNKIVYEINRPDKKLVELFREMPVANIDDNMGRIAAIDAAIRPMNRSPLLGTAFTIRMPQGDNLMFHKAMDMALPGDVIMIDAGGSVDRAIFGELMVSYCRVRGIAGIVCDGAIRDLDGISTLTDFAVYAKGVTPNGPYKNGPGEINVPIVIGGKTVKPGDIIVGDGDGIVIIDPVDAEALAAATCKTMEKEAKIMENIIHKGEYIRPWVDEKLKEIGCDF